LANTRQDRQAIVQQSALQVNVGTFQSRHIPVQRGAVSGKEFLIVRLNFKAWIVVGEDLSNRLNGAIALVDDLINRYAHPVVLTSVHARVVGVRNHIPRAREAGEVQIGDACVGVVLLQPI